ncbi:MAG TPA: PaaI family thioesterase [Jatrophihabitantaceae bacterium]|nr:PaaI family thioesterase [Jatrophihabitantaceae bacterium]
MPDPLSIPDIAPIPPPERRTGDDRELARDRLGASLRAVLDATVRTSANTADIDAARAAVDAATTILTRLPAHRVQQDNPFHALSLVGGSAHPAGPQLYVEPSGDGVAGTVCLGPAFEGGPGLAHGGILALMFDHAMGAAVFLAGYAAMTRTLDVVYLAPTPLDTDLHVTAQVDRVDGRKVQVSARVEHGTTVTATASAVFVALTRDNVAAIFHTPR